MKYIEEHYTSPNKDGLIGCIFIPQPEEKAAPAESEPETAPAEVEPEADEPTDSDKQEKPKRK